MSSSYIAISLIKRSNMSKEQLAIFLLNVSKEVLSDYLNGSKIINSPTNLTKKMIELIINDGILTTGNGINILTNNTEIMKFHDTYFFIHSKYNEIN